MTQQREISCSLLVLALLFREESSQGYDVYIDVLRADGAAIVVTIGL